MADLGRILRGPLKVPEVCSRARFSLSRLLLQNSIRIPGEYLEIFGPYPDYES